MSRYQKLSLLVGSLILIALIGLIAIDLLKPNAAISPTSAISADALTSTWVVQFAATHAETIQAISTSVFGTMNSP